MKVVFLLKTCCCKGFSTRVCHCQNNIFAKMKEKLLINPLTNSVVTLVLPPRRGVVQNKEGGGGGFVQKRRTGDLGSSQSRWGGIELQKLEGSGRGGGLSGVVELALEEVKVGLEEEEVDY